MCSYERILRLKDSSEPKIVAQNLNQIGEVGDEAIGGGLLQTKMMKKKAFVKKGKKVAPTCPTPRSGHLFLASDADETMYVVGGHNDSGPQNDVWSYQPSSQIWEIVDNEESDQQSPFPRFEFDGCMIGSYIYLFGGFQSDGTDVSILNDLWAFDLEYQSWNLVSDESSAPERSGHVVVAIDDGRFIVHGGTCLGVRADLWVHSTLTGHWDEIISTNVPCARSMHSAVYCKESQTLAIFGGITHTTGDNDSPPEYLNDLWVMRLGDDANDWQWSMIEYQGIAPSPRDLPALVTVDGNILLFGGFGFVETDEMTDSDVDHGEIIEDEDDEDQLLVMNGSTMKLETEVKNLDSENSDTDIISSAAGCILSDENILIEGMSDIGLEEQIRTETEKPEGPIVPETMTFPLTSETDENPTSGALADNIDDDDDDDDSGGIAIDYLLDTWYIDLATGESVEVDLPYLSAPKCLKKGEEDFPSIPRRGCKFVTCATGTIISFGGYDGELFFGVEERFDVDRLREFLTESD